MPDDQVNILWIMVDQMRGDSAGFMHHPVVRTRRWKYIHYVGEPGELYDVQKDPGERRNLFDDADVREARSQMQGLLLDWLSTSENTPPPDTDNPYFREPLSPLG